MQARKDEECGNDELARSKRQGVLALNIIAIVCYVVITIIVIVVVTIYGLAAAAAARAILAN